MWKNRKFLTNDLNLFIYDLTFIFKFCSVKSSMLFSVADTGVSVRLAARSYIYYVDQSNMYLTENSFHDCYTAALIFSN